MKSFALRYGIRLYAIKIKALQSKLKENLNKRKSSYAILLQICYENNAIEIKQTMNKRKSSIAM